jgi:hypothetical protein
MKLVVIGHDVKNYYGDYAGTENDLIEAIKSGAAVKMDNVWELVTVRQHAVNQQTGQILAETRMHLLMPIDMCPKGMDDFFIVPVGWYDTEKSGAGKKFAELLSKAEESAAKERARDAGIVTTDSGIRGVVGTPGLREASRPKR